MRRPYLPVLALTLAAAAACGSSGKGTVSAPPASGGASSSAPSSSAAPTSAAPTSAAPTSAAPSSAPASANGEAAKSATLVLADARAALTAAHSVHIKGGGSSGGSKIGLDLRLLGSQGGVGTITLRGTVLQLFRKGTQVYVKGDDAFYKAFAGTGSKGAAVAQLLHGKWLKTTTANRDFASLTDFTDTAAFAKHELTPSGALVKGKPGMVRGLPTVSLVDGAKGTLSVAASGPAYPLRLSSSSSASDAGTIDFLDYDAPVSLTPPPAADTVDLDSLSGFGSSAPASAAG